MQAQSNKYAETIKIMKQGLSHIVQDYKYPTVDAFLQVYKQGKSEYESYVKANKEWNSKYGETQSIESWQKTGRSSETGTGQRF